MDNLTQEDRMTTPLMPFISAEVLLRYVGQHFLNIGQDLSNTLSVDEQKENQGKNVPRKPLFQHMSYRVLSSPLHVWASLFFKRIMGKEGFLFLLFVGKYSTSPSFENLFNWWWLASHNGKIIYKSWYCQGWKGIPDWNRIVINVT